MQSNQRIQTQRQQLQSDVQCYEVICRHHHHHSNGAKQSERQKLTAQQVPFLGITASIDKHNCRYQANAEFRNV